MKRRRGMLFKLTHQDGTTRKGEDNETQWGGGVTHTAKGKPHYPPPPLHRLGRQMCTDEVIHAYRSPEIAVFANGLHAEIGNPLCWRARGRVLVEDGLKVGCKTLTTLEIVPLPVLTKQHKAKIALRTIDEEKLGDSKDSILWAWQIREHPEYVVAGAAIRVENERDFAKRLTARIKRVIQEGANPPAGGIKPDAVFFDEAGE